MEYRNLILSACVLCVCAFANAQSFSLTKGDVKAAKAAQLQVTTGRTASGETDSLAERIVITQNADGSFSAVKYDPKYPENINAQDVARDKSEEQMIEWLDSFGSNAMFWGGYFRVVKPTDQKKLLR